MVHYIPLHSIHIHHQMASIWLVLSCKPSSIKAHASLLFLRVNVRSTSLFLSHSCFLSPSSAAVFCLVLQCCQLVNYVTVFPALTSHVWVPRAPNPTLTSSEGPDFFLSVPICFFVVFFHTPSLSHHHSSLSSLFSIHEKIQVPRLRKSTPRNVFWLFFIRRAVLL